MNLQRIADACYDLALEHLFAHGCFPPDLAECNTFFDTLHQIISVGIEKAVSMQWESIQHLFRKEVMLAARLAAVAERRRILHLLRTPSLC